MKTRTDTDILVKALRVLAQGIKSGDGAANTAIAEAADRLHELRDKVVEQGLTLACLTDCILGEDAEERSEGMLLRMADAMKRENAELRKQLLQKTQLLEQENLRLVSILSRIRNVVDHSPDMSQATRLEWVGEYLDDALGRKEAQP